EKCNSIRFKATTMDKNLLLPTVSHTREFPTSIFPTRLSLQRNRQASSPECRPMRLTATTPTFLGRRSGVFSC
ncbi:unnamed protein product, partial [Ceratitis capitata]